MFKNTILVVDDEIENIKLILTNIFQSHNYKLLFSESGEDAIKKVNTHNIDLILLDVKMPKLNGFEVCKIIKNNTSTKEIPILFLSAYTDTDNILNGFKVGGTDYISKPFKVDEVMARVKVHLDLKNHKEELKKSLLQTKKLQKLQDFFVKKIIHEISTPLTSISLNTDILLKRYRKQKNLKIIKASIKILDSIYQDITFIAKRKKIVYRRKWINFKSFLENRLKYFYEISSTKNIPIILNMKSNILIYFNEIELQRFIDNNISNAIKYSKVNSIVKINVELKDEFLLISFEDSGIGLDLDEIEKIFNNYYKSVNQTLGLGLGLSIVKNICDKYEIDISIDSKKSIGSTFKYKIPIKIIKQ